MTALESRLETDGFGPFFRSYTKTWVHAVATAGLTAFGTLTFVNTWFAALALAAYVVPPVALYLQYRNGTAESDAAKSAGEAGTESDTAISTDDAGMESASSGDSRPEPTTDSTTRESTADSSGATVSADSDPEEHFERGDSSGSDESETDGSSVSGGSETDDKPSTPDAEVAEWSTVETPTDATLRDVAVGPSGVYAVGDGGTVLARGDEWDIVLEDGPAAGSNDLRGADATADGEAVWVAGDSGALGCIDAETGRHTDYTAPEDITDNWLGVAVGGDRGAETILLINGSGAILRGRNREGDLEWAGPDKPGSGSSFSAVALCEDGVGYCCDTSDGVYETTDGGESFERVGLEGASGTLTDVATTGHEDCLVSADDGVVHRYGGSTWTPERVADGSLTGVDRAGERAVACAEDGAIYERTTASAEWERIDVDASDALLAVSLGSDRGVAVGENGAVVERRR